MPGAVVDDAVGTLLLDTLTPHALEVALTVQGELDSRAAAAGALRRQAVERARRRYLAVDPDNRLVAGSLEADWNDALRTLQTARGDYENASAAATPTDHVKDRIGSLATEFPAIWCNPHTPQRDRKRMVHLLVDDVTLHETDGIHLHVRLRGGRTTSLTVPIPPKAWRARQTRPDTLAALDRLLAPDMPGGSDYFGIGYVCDSAGHGSLPAEICARYAKPKSLFETDAAISTATGACRLDREPRRSRTTAYVARSHSCHLSLLVS